MANEHTKPSNLLFKWIGGKKWLTKTLKSEIEKVNFNGTDTYIEPFIGGMGAFFALFDTLKDKGVSRFVLNDINEIIILTYNLVKHKPNDVINLLSVLEKDYDNSISNKNLYTLNKTKDKEQVKALLVDAEKYFREVKKNFNKLKKIKNRSDTQELEIASLFLFLQDHSFNGVYRENNSGEYNTPFNWDCKQYNMTNKKKTILEYSDFFNKNNVEFRNLDVFDLIEEFLPLSKSSFLYLDPPYLNEDEKSENQYNKDHFTGKEQKKLLETLKQFDSFMFSNHLLPLFENYFNNTGHRYISVARKNIMSANKDNRSNDILEILGTKDK